MPKKPITFTIRPDNNFGVNLSVTFADAGNAKPRFVVGEGPTFNAKIQDLPGGATVTAAQDRLVFQNFPVTNPTGEKITGGSPILRVTFVVESEASKVSFNITNLDAAITGFFPTIQIENQNLFLGESNEFSLI